MLEKLPREFPLPKTTRGAASYMHRLGITLSELSSLEAAAARELTEARERIERKYAPRTQRLAERALGLAFALEQFAEHTRAARSEVSLAEAGTLKWISRRSAIISDTQKAIAEIQRRGESLAAQALKTETLVSIRKAVVSSHHMLFAGMKHVAFEMSDLFVVRPTRGSLQVTHDRKAGKAYIEQAPKQK